jgi:hypothetical protein
MSGTATNDRSLGKGVCMIHRSLECLDRLVGLSRVLLQELPDLRLLQRLSGFLFQAFNGTDCVRLLRLLLGRLLSRDVEFLGKLRIVLDCLGRIWSIIWAKSFGR